MNIVSGVRDEYATTISAICVDKDIEKLIEQKKVSITLNTDMLRGV